MKAEFDGSHNAQEFSPHAARKIEQENQIERFFLEAQVQDWLEPAFVRELKIRFSQAFENNARRIEHFRVDTNQRDAGMEHDSGFLGKDLHSRQAGKGENGATGYHLSIT